MRSTRPHALRSPSVPRHAATARGADRSGSPSATRSDEPPVAAQAVTRSLAALELALIRHRCGVRGRLGVSDDELAVLLFVAHERSVPQSRLGALSTLSRSGMGALVQRLEDTGWIERGTSPEDRRVRLVSLSAYGRKRLDAAYRDFHDAVSGALADAATEVLTAFVPLLTAIAGAADAAGTPLAAPGSVPPPAPDPIWRDWG